MAYSEDKTPAGLTAITELADDDVIVVGDASDANEAAKGITKTNLAYTLPVFVSGTGVAITFTISDTEPVSPSTHDLWLDIS